MSADARNEAGRLSGTWPAAGPGDAAADPPACVPDHDPGGRIRLAVDPDTVSAAEFSDCRRYRWWLERRWDGQPIGSGGHVAMIGMNPSTADLAVNDPTVAGCIKRARLWGFGAFVMLNAFGYRSTDQAGLLSIGDAVGAGNDAAILRFSATAVRVVVGWGKPPKPLAGRGRQVAALLATIGVQPLCFAVNADGSPKHPLYVRHDAPLIPWRPA